MDSSCLNKVCITYVQTSTNHFYLFPFSGLFGEDHHGSVSRKRLDTFFLEETTKISHICVSVFFYVYCLCLNSCLNFMLCVTLPITPPPPHSSSILPHPSPTLSNSYPLKSLSPSPQPLSFQVYMYLISCIII